MIEHFQDLPDPRVNRTKDHDLMDILVIAICTLLCAGESFNDMEDFGQAKQDWFKTFLRWTQSLRQAVNQEIVALDGKALRRALRRKGRLKYMVSAWAEDNGLVLGQLKVADKSNQITALPELLRVLELAGCIVTVDAMGCQKNIAKVIQEAAADYVLALKGNQEVVHEEVKSFLDAAVAERAARPRRPSWAAATLAVWETVEKDHGRIEIHRY